MNEGIFASEALKEAFLILRDEIPFAIWETFYVTVVSTLFAVIIGLPLGVLLVAGEKGGVLPLPGIVLRVLNVIINLLRSISFLILMIIVFPLTRLIVGYQRRNHRFNCSACHSCFSFYCPSGRGESSGN